MERKKLNIWTASSFFIFLTYLVFLVYPIVTVLKQALIHEGQFSLANFEDFFSKSYYSETLVNSFNAPLLLLVTSLVLGTLLAYLFSIYDFKGKKFLQILIIIASMSAPFVGAYSWILLLGRNGVITKFLDKYPSSSSYRYLWIQRNCTCLYTATIPTGISIRCWDNEEY